MGQISEKNHLLAQKRNEPINRTGEEEKEKHERFGEKKKKEKNREIFKKQ